MYSCSVLFCSVVVHYRDIHSLLNQCLLLAIERGDLPLMRLLLDNDAFPDGMDNSVCVVLCCVVGTEHFVFDYIGAGYESSYVGFGDAASGMC
jgi:hypothetical protein